MHSQSGRHYHQYTKTTPLHTHVLSAKCIEMGYCCCFGLLGQLKTLSFVWQVPENENITIAGVSALSGY